MFPQSTDNILKCNFGKWRHISIFFKVSDPANELKMKKKKQMWKRRLPHHLLMESWLCGRKKSSMSLLCPVVMLGWWKKNTEFDRGCIPQSQMYGMCDVKGFFFIIFLFSGMWHTQWNSIFTDYSINRK